MAFAPFPDAQYLSDGTRTEGEMKAAFENWLLATKQTSGTAQVALAQTGPTTLALVPYHGNRLLVGARSIPVPPQGWTLSNAGLTASTTYWIGAVDAADDGAITLQAFAPGPPYALATDAESGMPTITGTPHGARVTHVGEATTSATSQFASATSRFHGIDILPNNRFLQGYKADGTTAQNLIGVGTDDHVYLAPGLDGSKRILIPTDSALSAKRADASLQHIASVSATTIDLAASPRNTLHIGGDSPADIWLGYNLTAGKNIYVPRLTVQGTLTLTDNTWVMASSGPLLMNYNGGNLYFSNAVNLVVNDAGGRAYFKRDLECATTIYKSGVGPYTFPDFVFEHAFTGGIERFRDAPGAAEYEGLWRLARVEEFAQEHWRLPGHAPRENDRVDIFRRTHDLLAELERVYLHLFAHERRLAALEGER